MWHGNNSKTWSMYKTKNEQRSNKISLEVLTGLPFTEEEYVVEEILDACLRHNKLECLVKWEKICEQE